MDGDTAVANIPREEDPFWEPPEDVLVGTANIFLQSLAFALDFDDKLSVTDYKVTVNSQNRLHIIVVLKGVFLSIAKLTVIFVLFSGGGTSFSLC